jgi:hypothetical protein
MSRNCYIRWCKFGFVIAFLAVIVGCAKETVPPRAAPVGAPSELIPARPEGQAPPSHRLIANEGKT